MTITWDEVTIDHFLHFEKVLQLYDLVFPIEVREPHEVFIKGLHYAKNRKPNRVNKINYLQPPLHKEHEPIPLNLFIKNLQKNETDRETIKRIIHAIYKEKYYLVNGINELVLNDSLQKMELD